MHQGVALTLGAVALAALGPRAHAQEARVEAAEFARIELSAPRASCFVGELVKVRMRVELAADFFATQALPLGDGSAAFAGRPPVPTRVTFREGA